MGLRLTAFPDTPFPLGSAEHVQQHWISLFGGTPERVEEDVQTSTVRVLGTSQSLRMGILQNPSTVEIRYFGVPPPPGQGLPLYNTVSPPFRATCQNAWERLPVRSLQRLAFGAELAVPITAPADANAVLGRYLPNIEPDDITIDFSYQSNRRCQSRVEPELELNRLVRWGVGEVQGIRVDLSAATLGVFEHRYECHLTLDINTVPSRKPNSQKIPWLFAELVELAEEIMQ